MPPVLSLANDLGRRSIVPWTPRDLQDARRYFASRLQFEIGCAELWRRMRDGERIVLVDVRSERCFHAGHIAGSVSYPASSFEASVAAALPTGPVVICGAGAGDADAFRVALTMIDAGVAARVLSGGVPAWDGEGFELVRDPIPPGALRAV